MLGTIVNTLLIFAGGLGGVFFAKYLKDNYKDIIMQAIPLSAMFMGISGAVKGLNSEGSSSILFILSLCIGSIVGEALNIEKKLADLGDFLQSRLAGSSSDSTLSKGFVTASLLFCIGTMGILGAIESGLTGTHTILFAKGIMDGITSIILASTYGVGVVLSGISVFIYQGSITMLSGFLSPIITGNAMTEISILGGIMIFSLGSNLLGITKIKVGNMLPAIFVPMAVCSPMGVEIISKITSFFN